MDIDRARKAASTFKRIAVCRNGRGTVVAACMSEDTGRTRRSVCMSVVAIATAGKMRIWIIDFRFRIVIIKYYVGACSTAIT